MTWRGIAGEQRYTMTSNEDDVRAWRRPLRVIYLLLVDADVKLTRRADWIVTRGCDATAVG